MATPLSSASILDTARGRKSHMNASGLLLKLTAHSSVARLTPSQSATYPELLSHPSLASGSCVDRVATLTGYPTPQRVKNTHHPITSLDHSASGPIIDWQTIDLETLENFEIVTDQFLAQGIHFENAIAIQPSNPAFAAPPFGKTMLMGAPKTGFIDVTFERPISQLEVWVTSSRPLTLTTFDHHHQLVTQTETLGCNLTEVSKAKMTPHDHLAIDGYKPIHRALLRCDGGNFTLSRLSFND